MSEREEKSLTIDELAAFCKRKGFVYPSGEIYGGLAGFWDFGPLGVELANNLKHAWWNYHVHQRDDVVGIDGSIITNPKVWEASGHVKNFIDYIVRDKKSGQEFKVDAHEIEQYKKSDKHIVEGAFNPMFTTHVGPHAGKGDLVYLRPETAQSIFTNFKLVYEQARLQLPCGIAQVGKAFRNEVAPREFLFRAREFEQMELEYFIAPETECPPKFMNEIKYVELALLTSDTQTKKQNSKIINLYRAWKKGIIMNSWHAYWLAQEIMWFTSLGVDVSHFRARQHTKDEKSHYAVDTWDLEYNFPMGWRELEGIANRGAYDLTQHQACSKSSFEVGVDAMGKKVLPEVVCEPSLGVGRAFIVFMLEAYEYDKKRDNVVLHLHPRLAPYKAAVFPIVKGDAYEKMAEKIVFDLRKEWNVTYDKSGSVGRRYSRADEIGVPVTIVVDEQSLKDKSITMRDRDSTRQIRVRITELDDIMRKIMDDKNLLKLGKVVKTRVK